MTSFESSKVQSSIYGVSDDDAKWATHMGRCDAVIEAVFEDLGVKHKVLQQLEAIVRPDALIATNTSAIPIEKIAAGAKHPERVCGIHYFSPVEKMPLAEIIAHKGTSPAAVALAVSLAQKQGKTVILVKDVPGFYVNRCLGPYMSEGMALLLAGVEPVALDKALKAFGWPVGPVSLMDEVGVDVSFHTFSTLKNALGDRMTGGSPEAMAEMLSSKMLGRKTGRGFYLYEPKSPKSKDSGGPRPINPDAIEILKRYRSATPANLSDEDLQQRMLLRFIKECILCAEDDILAPGSRDANPKVAYATGDVGAVYGIGFPPFLGGPFRYCDIVGLSKVADSMQRLADTVGPHFSPPKLLLDLARQGKTFHGN